MELMKNLFAEGGLGGTPSRTPSGRDGDKTPDGSSRTQGLEPTVDSVTPTQLEAEQARLGAALVGSSGLVEQPGSELENKNIRQVYFKNSENEEERSSKLKVQE